ncbi:Fe-S cluster assembly protein SufE [Halopseudomonas pachastrellae]|uniref:Fe-S cluster assembly protein SufE n=1 Tax=Halopseudomonas pachastrellae TaxID=254161 RepID=A0A1S8DI18_9GAMM|nr:SufE family protein [Halopseudomonas pachastrellae]ONM45033.1 Fe-S cluster assembly protein SufE [Halopseudomonas pachastrellae]SFM17999.1 cysteine desulfuration protein SufE [Halopseudomonas pachastrellae]
MSRFGTDITSDDIVDTLSFFDSWEDRYKYIIDLGRELPELAAEQRTEDNLVRGCQSQVWLVSRREGDRLYFDADSDAFIVKGLLAVVLAAYNGKRADEIRDFDIEGYFASLNLLKHLSVTRGNGLRAMVQRIQASAAA